jgi:hypothetical protein
VVAVGGVSEIPLRRALRYTGVFLPHPHQTKRKKMNKIVIIAIVVLTIVLLLTTHTGMAK